MDKKRINYNRIISVIILSVLVLVAFMPNISYAAQKNKSIDLYTSLNIEIPNDYSQSYKIKVDNPKHASFSIENVKYNDEWHQYNDLDIIKVSKSGVVTPNIVNVYNYSDGGGWGHGTYIKEEGREPTSITKEVIFGTAVVHVKDGSKRYDVEVSVKSYTDIYVENVVNDYINKNFSSSMSFEEKLKKICEFPASYDYSTSSHSMRGMISTGGGTCWASADATYQLCKKLGIKAYIRDANKDPGAGNGHVNTIAVKEEGQYFILEAGYSSPKNPETGLRPYTIIPRDSLFSSHYTEGGREIYQYDGDINEVSKLIFPEKIDGKLVLSVSDFIPRTDDFNRTIKTIVLPNTLKRIGDDSFNSAHGLETINIPANVETIGIRAFTECYNLKNINVDPRNKYISQKNGVLYSNKTIFSGPNCTQADLSGSASEILDYAFYRNKNLCDVTFGDNIKTVGEGAFGDCNKITNLNLGKVETIGDFAFKNAKSYDDLVIPATVKSIGVQAFDYKEYNDDPDRSFFFKGNAPSMYASDSKEYSFPKDAVLYYVEGTEGWDAAVPQSYTLRKWDGVHKYSLKEFKIRKKKAIEAVTLGDTSKYTDESAKKANSVLEQQKKKALSAVDKATTYKEVDSITVSTAEASKYLETHEEYNARMLKQEKEKKIKEIEKTTLGDTDGMRENSIKRAELKLKENKKNAIDQVNQAKSIKQVKAVKVDVEGARKLLVPKKGGWVVENGKYSYYEDDVRFENGWKKIKGSTYYFRDGYRVNEIQEIDGKYYYFGYKDGKLYKKGWLYFWPYDNYVYADKNDGHFLMGKQTIKDKSKPSMNGTCYFDPNNLGLRYRGIKTVDGNDYYFDWNNYKVVKQGLLYFWPYDNYVYTDKNDGHFVTGWKNIGGDTYYFSKTNGHMYHELAEIDGNHYYFGWKNGKLYKSGWLNFSGLGKRVYADRRDGHFLTGQQRINGKEYLFGQEGFAKRGINTIDGRDYYYDWNNYHLIKQGLLYFWPYENYVYTDLKDGHFVTGWKTIGNDTYFFSETNGHMYHELAEIDGMYYYFGYKNGKLYKGGWLYFWPYKNYVYTDLKDGHFITGWFDNCGNTYYLSLENGHRYKGEGTIDGKKFYFGWNDGKLYKNGWLYLYPYKTWVYADPNTGEYLTGEHKLPEGRDQNGKIMPEGTYIFNSNGRLINIADVA